MQPAGRRSVVDVALQGGARSVPPSRSTARRSCSACGSATPLSVISRAPPPSPFCSSSAASSSL